MMVTTMIMKIVEGRTGRTEEDADKVITVTAVATAVAITKSMTIKKTSHSNDDDDGDEGNLRHIIS